MFRKGIIVILFSAFAIADEPISGQVCASYGNPLSSAVIANSKNQNLLIDN